MENEEQIVNEEETKQEIVQEEKLTIKTIFSDIGIGVKYIFSFKMLLYLIIVILFVNFFFVPLTSNFLPYFIVSDVASSEYLFKDFMQPEMWNSIVSVSVGVGMIIMAMILSVKKQKDKIINMLRIGFISVDLIFIAMAVIYFIFTKKLININVVLIEMVVGGLLLGLTLPIVNIPTTTKMMTLTEKDKLGKVMSVVSVGSQGLTYFSKKSPTSI